MDKVNKINKSYNFSNTLMIILLTFLYVLFINKLAVILSNYNQNNTDNEIIKNYSLIIYLLSIVSIVIAFIYFDDNKKNSNFILKWSLNIGSCILLIYLILNYWDYLDEYSKLVLLSICIMAIIYYIYKFY
jgi:cytochrome bd-type quinol oxidase subunit 2